MCFWWKWPAKYFYKINYSFDYKIKLQIFEYFDYNVDDGKKTMSPVGTYQDKCWVDNDNLFNFKDKI